MTGARSSSKPFDVAMKHLLEMDPRRWAQLLGSGDHGDVEVIDSDLATVTAAADKVLKLSLPRPWLKHVEFQASYDPEGDWRILQYKVLLRRRERLPVESVVVLLRPDADGPAFNGTLLETGLEDNETSLLFRYRVVRLWEIPVETFLTGSLATLPLAPLAKLTNAELPNVMRRISERLSETSVAEAQDLLTSTFLLLGLKVRPEEATQLMQGIRAMRESSTYQWILSEGEATGVAKGVAKGEVSEARAILIRLGAKRFGVPDEWIMKRLDAVNDKFLIEGMIDRVGDARDWNDLLS